MSTRQNQLRDLCKANGIKGYGKHGNAVLMTMLKGAGVDVPAASEAAPRAAKPAKKAAKRTPKTATAGKRGGSRDGSIRTWLTGQLDKHGKVDIAAALAEAEKSGRSKVTVYRQARELGLSANRKEHVFEKTK